MDWITNLFDEQGHFSEGTLLLLKDEVFMSLHMSTLDIVTLDAIKVYLHHSAHDGLLPMEIAAIAINVIIREQQGKQFINN